jgi:hypothetical protein
MEYLSYSVVNGVIVAGQSATITPNCIFEVSGNIWSIDGPTLGFLCSIVVTWVNKAAGLVAYDKRPLDGTISNVNLSNLATGAAWGTAIVQPDGRYVISI